jgi:hypothetical protein
VAVQVIGKEVSVSLENTSIICGSTGNRKRNVTKMLTLQGDCVFTENMDSQDLM